MGGLGSGGGQEKLFLPRLIKRGGNRTLWRSSDYGLDKLLDSIFGASRKEDQYVGRTARAIANEVVLHPETLPDIIKSRQEVLQYFIDRPQFERFVLENGIKHPRGMNTEWTWHCKEMKECLESYMSLVSALDVMFKLSDNQEIKVFHKGIQELKTWDTFKELEQLITDLNAPGTLNISVYAYPDIGVQFTVGIPYKLEFRTASKEWTSSSAYGDAYPRLYFPGKRLMEGLEDKLEEHGLLDKNGKLKKRIEIALTISDHPTQEVWADVWYETKPFFGKEERVNFGLRLSPSHFEAKEHGENFALTIQKAKYHRLKDKFQRFHERLVAPFHETLAELKYLTLLSRYFREQKEKGKAVTMPAVEDKENNMTFLTDMVNPVARQLQPSRIYNVRHENLNVICGPIDCGETEYLQGIALAQVMMQAGWMVFAEEAVMSPKDDINAYFFTERRKGHSELEQMRLLIEKATPYSLIILEQPFACAYSEDGTEWATSVVGALEELGATTYVATQFRRVHQLAHDSRFAKVFHTSRLEDGKPSYTLAKGIVDFCREDDAEITSTTEEQLRRALHYRQDKKQIRLRNTEPTADQIIESIPPSDARIREKK